MQELESIRLAVQTLAGVVAIVAGLIAAFRGLREMRVNREQRHLELKWNRVKLAHDMMEALWKEEKVMQAVRMLSWKRQKYLLEDDRVVTLTKKRILHALRISDLRFTDEEKHVRCCFSELFARLGRIEHFIDRNLVDFDDVSHAFIERAGYFDDEWDVYRDFMLQYSCFQALAFLKRFGDLPEEAMTKTCSDANSMINGQNGSAPKVR